MNPDLPHGVVALVLAGGRGERLGALTTACAKPALTFGSSYRVIDFSLSNCLNSGIHRIGVVTQYQARTVASHVRRAWNQQRRTRHCIELWDAARQAPDGRYHGTADAVYRNLDNLRTHAPRLLLVLAGDHIYQMDYRPMIAAHLASGASATVACIEAPLEEASRYGVLGTTPDFRIDSFAEKPAQPTPMPGHTDRALVSMGIYLFDFAMLARVLADDAAAPTSSHDFGNDVIPRIIRSQHVHAYRFHDRDGRACFWRDVGTPDAYHETSMALLDGTPGLDPSDLEWPILSGTANPHPVRFLAGSGARVQPLDPAARVVPLEGTAVRSSLGPGCTIAGGIVVHSVLGEGVRVGSGALLQDTVVLPDAVIGDGTTLRNTIVAAGCQVPAGTRIGVPATEDTIPCLVTPGGVRVLTQADVDHHTQHQGARSQTTTHPAFAAAS
ncbi:MAG: NTP transferase domain-containing protein [Pseudomonadales bacterium]|nr:NTP transferase domain-containing protein [Pseudomonadales bacterium]